MSKYTDHVSVEWVEGITYILTEDLVWYIGHKDSGIKYTVYAGETFDVSIPWYLRWIFSPHDNRYFKASSMHDKMLREGWSRVESAGPFERMLAADQVETWRRIFMFLSVAFFRYGVDEEYISSQ